jgi:plasmid stabilization system protein ParE
MDKKFTLRYLPLFEQDLTAARDYIALNLKNPTAAQRLVEDTEQAILKRLNHPLGFMPYHTNKNRLHPYYRIHIRNYTVFYVVIGDVMEIRRFLYSRRNLPEFV